MFRAIAYRQFYANVVHSATVTTVQLYIKQKSVRFNKGYSLATAFENVPDGISKLAYLDLTVTSQWKQILQAAPQGRQM